MEQKVLGAEWKKIIRSTLLFANTSEVTFTGIKYCLRRSPTGHRSHRNVSFIDWSPHIPNPLSIKNTVQRFPLWCRKGISNYLNYSDFRLFSFYIKSDDRGWQNTVISNRSHIPLYEYLVEVKRTYRVTFTGTKYCLKCPPTGHHSHRNENLHVFTGTKIFMPGVYYFMCNINYENINSFHLSALVFDVREFL